MILGLLMEFRRKFKRKVRQCSSVLSVSPHSLLISPLLVILTLVRDSEFALSLYMQAVKFKAQ